MAKKKHEAIEGTPIYPSPDTPAIFVDGFQGVQLNDGVFRINFYRTFYPPDKETGEYRKPVLVMLVPIGGLASIHEVFGRILSDAQADGVIQAVPPDATSEPDNG